MKPASINLLLMVLLLWPGPAAAAEPVLLAHGSEQTLWIALSRAGQRPEEPELRTVLRYRQTGGPWRELGSVADRVIDLANRGDQLLLVLQSGDWMLLWPGGSAVGPLPPSGASLIALAAEEGTVWAVALTPGGAAGVRPPATAPSLRSRRRTTAATTTTTTAPATAPTTQPARLALLRFTGTSWAGVADLPDVDPAANRPLSLAVVEGQPTVALQRSPRMIEAVELTDGRWSPVARITLPFEVTDFKLLAHGSLGRLWAAPATGGGILTSLEPAARQIELELPEALQDASQRAPALAIERLRMLVAQGDRLHEIAYDPNTLQQSAATPVEEPPPPVDPTFGVGLQFALMAGFVLLVAGTLRRLDATREATERQDTLPLAPVLPRLSAGLIDALPVLGTFFFIIFRAQDEEQLARWLLGWPMFVAIVVYLLYTCLSELATARTVGKWLFGLRVASLDGGPPLPGAIVTRNFLRLVDVIPPLPALLLISRLRQRPGDAAAGTLVLVDSDRNSTEALDEDRA